MPTMSAHSRTKQQIFPFSAHHSKAHVNVLRLLIERVQHGKNNVEGVEPLLNTIAFKNNDTTAADLPLRSCSPPTSAELPHPILAAWIPRCIVALTDSESIPQKSRHVLHADAPRAATRRPPCRGTDASAPLGTSAAANISLYRF
jgi:hypothetical protein